jgi:hypothetical protein
VRKAAKELLWDNPLFLVRAERGLIDPKGPSQAALGIRSDNSKESRDDLVGPGNSPT